MQSYTVGEVITRYGDIGDRYYMLAEGTVSVKVYQPGTSPFDANLESKLTIQKELTPDPQMIGFGEIALLLNSKRTATIQAVTDAKCWYLDADVFKHIIAQNTLRRRNINLKSLDNVNLFNGLD
jgi:CRP-like cAMP-binding protein